jgi:hypothetical protein
VDQKQNRVPELKAAIEVLANEQKEAASERERVVANKHRFIDLEMRETRSQHAAELVEEKVLRVESIDMQWKQLCGSSALSLVWNQLRFGLAIARKERLRPPTFVKLNLRVDKVKRDVRQDPRSIETDKMTKQSIEAASNQPDRIEKLLDAPTEAKALIDTKDPDGAHATGRACLPRARL